MLMRMSCTLFMCLFIFSVSAQQHLKKFRSVSNITALGNKVLFSADEDNNDHEEELWISDGSPEGTKLVKDIVLLQALTGREMISFHDEVYFAAYHREFQTELWKSDGTPAGTKMVKNIAPDDNSYYGG
ncbi:MAG TPA: hypothetical protein VE467_07465, partial [Chryseolinea sp.]|nr:hypothetical protein [Chryseolinea sp.]